MEFKPLKLALAASLLSLLAFPALAQDKKPSPDAECSLSVGEIMNLREPQFGSINTWDLVYAEDGMDIFADAVSLDGEKIVAAGSYTKDKKDEIYHPLIVKYDERHKKVWEVRADTKTQQTIQRIVQTKDGFTVLGDITDAASRKGIYIASYDNDGKVKGEPVPVYETGGDLIARAFVPASDATGYIIAAQFIDAKNRENQNGMLYKISRDGKLDWKRSFKPGQSTVFNNIQTMLDGSYAVSGQIVLDDNTSGGWFLRISDNGSIKMQYTYPRGLAASLMSATQTKGGNYILTGKARPSTGNPGGLAAWIMMTDALGKPVWQRFFKGPYSYDAADAIVYEDGRSSILINGDALDGQHRSHARLMTLSPLGQIQKLEDYTDGQNASARRLIAGLDGTRIIIGHAQTSFSEEQEDNNEPAPDYTYDGWLVAAPSLDIYEDPCAKVPNMSPILP